MIEVTHITHLLWVKSALVIGDRWGRWDFPIYQPLLSCPTATSNPSSRHVFSFQQEKGTKGHIFLVNSILDPLRSPGEPNVVCVDLSSSEGSLLIIALKDGGSRLFARGCWPGSSLWKQTWAGDICCAQFRHMAILLPPPPNKLHRFSPTSRSGMPVGRGGCGPLPWRPRLTGRVLLKSDSVRSVLMILPQTLTYFPWESGSAVWDRAEFQPWWDFCDDEFHLEMPVNPSKLSQLLQQCPASIIQCPKMSSTPTFVSRHPVSRISLSIIITVLLK